VVGVVRLPVVFPTVGRAWVIFGEPGLELPSAVRSPVGWLLWQLPKGPARNSSTGYPTPGLVVPAGDRAGGGS